MAWIGSFIQLHTVRFEHPGRVCFGDYIGQGSETYPFDPESLSSYLISEGKFLNYLIVSQWIIIAILWYGLLSSLIVVALQKFDSIS